MISQSPARFHKHQTLCKVSNGIMCKGGELVFLTQDAAIVIIEVKSRTNMQILGLALEKFEQIGRKLGVQVWNKRPEFSETDL